MLESELFTLLQHTSDAAFSVTEEGEIMSWNKGAEKLFGYPSTAAIHKTCYEILEGMGPVSYTHLLALPTSACTINKPFPPTSRILFTVTPIFQSLCQNVASSSEQVSDGLLHHLAIDV